MHHRARHLSASPRHQRAEGSASRAPAVGAGIEQCFGRDAGEGRDASARCHAADRLSALHRGATGAGESRLSAGASRREAAADPPEHRAEHGSSPGTVPLGGVHVRQPGQVDRAAEKVLSKPVSTGAAQVEGVRAEPVRYPEYRETGALARRLNGWSPLVLALIALLILLIVPPFYFLLKTSLYTTNADGSFGDFTFDFYRELFSSPRMPSHFL